VTSFEILILVEIQYCTNFEEGGRTLNWNVDVAT